MHEIMAAQHRCTWVLVALIATTQIGFIRAQALNLDGSGECPSSCPSLPAKQRTASSLASALVAFVGCDGKLAGAARAVIAAASSGDTEAFSAGMAVGAATLTGKDHPDGQMADALTETFTVADAGGRAKAVAAAVGAAIESLPGGAQAAMMADVIASLNELADNGQCALAGTSAFEMYRALKSADKATGGKLLALAAAKGRLCWKRRLLRLAASAAFNKPAPVSPCSKYMRDASAISVSLISASACGLPEGHKLEAAAHALVTAASGAGCSFASAVSSVSLAGLANSSAILSVYASAIPAAKRAGATGALANGFAAALYEVVGVQGDASGLLDDLVTAVARTVDATGCPAAADFASGVFTRLAAQQPDAAGDLKAAFEARPSISKCNYALELPSAKREDDAAAAAAAAGDAAAGEADEQAAAASSSSSPSSPGGAKLAAAAPSPSPAAAAPAASAPSGAKLAAAAAAPSPAAPKAAVSSSPLRGVKAAATAAAAPVAAAVSSALSGAKAALPLPVAAKAAANSTAKAAAPAPAAPAAATKASAPSSMPALGTSSSVPKAAAASSPAAANSSKPIFAGLASKLGGALSGTSSSGNKTATSG